MQFSRSCSLMLALALLAFTACKTPQRETRYTVVPIEPRDEAAVVVVEEPPVAEPAQPPTPPAPEVADVSPEPQPPVIPALDPHDAEEPQPETHATPPPIETTANTFEGRLAEAVAHYEQSLGARIAVSYIDVETGANIHYRGDELFHPASTMKVPVMIEVFRQAEQGLFMLTDIEPIVIRFPSMIDGSPFDVAPGRALREEVGKPVTVRRLVEEMIQVSDNVATNMLMARCGPQRITASMRQLGATKSYIIRALMDEEAFQAGMSNRMTANDLSRLMAAIQTDRAASPESCEQMRQILLGQRYRTMIPSGVPEGVDVANKTGSITGHRHDTAIVYAPSGAFALTILMMDVGESAPATQAGVALTRFVYNEHEARRANN